MDDRFELGQWMRGGIYERRADLSPDDRHLIYFAMNGQWSSDTGGSWTAISRAPYLHALVLLGKGDCWHGGGLFTDGGRDVAGARRGCSSLAAPRCPRVGTSWMHARPSVRAARLRVRGLSVKPRVYVETTVLSYLTAFVSDAMLEEMRVGDEDAARRRLSAAQRIAVLATTPDAQALARARSSA